MRRPPAMQIPLRALAALVLTIALCACGTDSPASSGGGMVDATGDWQLTSGRVDGAAFPVVADSPITMTVEGMRIGGRSACNAYGGEIVVDGGRVRFEQMSMTEMACQEPVMAAEAAYLAALGRIVGAALDGDRLVLTGPGVELDFERLAPPPIAELVGTDWVLQSIVQGDVVSSIAGEPATLRLEPGGTFKGSTGCRTFSGRWVTANGGITPTEFGMDQTECPPDLAAQDSHVTSVIEGFRASIDGQTLTLTGDGGDGLIYTAAE
jgi:heat shock protein HslJ